MPANSCVPHTCYRWSRPYDFHYLTASAESSPDYAAHFQSVAALRRVNSRAARHRNATLVGLDFAKDIERVAFTSETIPPANVEIDAKCESNAGDCSRPGVATGAPTATVSGISRTLFAAHALDWRRFCQRCCSRSERRKAWTDGTRHLFEDSRLAQQNRDTQTGRDNSDGNEDLTKRSHGVTSNTSERGNHQPGETNVQLATGSSVNLHRDLAMSRSLIYSSSLCEGEFACRQPKECFFEVSPPATRTGETFLDWQTVPVVPREVARPESAKGVLPLLWTITIQ